MASLVFFGGVAACLGLLLALVLGIWRLLGRNIVSFLVGFATALVLGVITGPYVIIGLVGMAFIANDAERRSEQPLVAKAYERPATLPARITHRFSVEITLKDEQGNRSRQQGEVIVTVVHDPKAFDGIGDGRLWTASGTPLSFSFGPHKATARWDARKLVDQCLLRRETKYPDYSKLYDALAALRGRCHNFTAAQFVTVDGKQRPIDWPEDVKAVNGPLTTVGPLAPSDPALTAMAR